MTYKFIEYNNNLEEIIIAKTNYKRENSIIARLAKEADKKFGKGKWEQVPNYDQSLDNVVGWYARCKDKDCGQTIEVKPIWE